MSDSAEMMLFIRTTAMSLAGASVQLEVTVGKSQMACALRESSHRKVNTT